MKIFGFAHGGHDSSYAILIDGKITIHEELERINRQKETRDDVVAYYLDKYGPLDDFDYIAYYPHGSGNSSLGDFNWFSQRFLDLWLENRSVLNGNEGHGTPRESMKNKIIEVGHHAAHAANAFYASDFQDALIFSIDGGGSDRAPDGNLYWSAFTAWKGTGNKIEQLYHDNFPSMGILWTNMLNEVFHLSAGGPPNGCQAGTIMGMAAYGDSTKFTEQDTQKILQYDNSGWYALSEEEQFNLAAKLQEVTEQYLVDKIKPYIEQHGIKNICFTGGVSLNCSMIGKMKKLLQVDNIFVPPVPYDAGLAMGVAQYVYHHVLDNPRSTDVSYKTPYLGHSYSKEEIVSTLTSRNTEVAYVEVEDSVVCNLLSNQKIVSVFGGRSESGRRALGNRSILADPRSVEIKNIINEKVKHRQSFRPFAPAILREHVSDWFEEDIDSPYMSFSVKFKDDKKELVPAVVHKDGTGRLQTVTEQFNPRFYRLLTEWHNQTQVPILLNTSFNDREPIVETPADAINCFLKTEIDYLYFTDYNLLVHKLGAEIELPPIVEDVVTLNPQHQKLLQEQPKIIVAQFYTSNVPHGPVAEKINSAYCDKHGYGYFVERDTEKIISTLDGKSATWYKPQLVLEIFEKYNPEYVLFLDIDAVILDHEERIENFISSNHDVVFTTDYGHHSKMNAGVFLIKNTNWSKYFLNKWWNSSDVFKGSDCEIMQLPAESNELVGYYRTGLWHDQTCLTILHNQNEDVRNMINIITNRKLNWRYAFDDNFVFHAFAYGNVPNRSLDSVYARLFNLPIKNESLKDLAQRFPVDRDYAYQFLSKYELVFSQLQNVRTVMEIGVHNHGNELEIWNRYFESAQVIGVNREFHQLNNDLRNVSLVKVNFDDDEDFTRFINKYSSVDIVIDDYTNKMEDQQRLLARLFKSLTPNGIYIIEDLQTSRQCKQSQTNWGDPTKTTTLEMLETFISSGTITSDYMTPEEQSYVQDHIANCEIYEGVPGSLTAIITKR